MKINLRISASVLAWGMAVVPLAHSGPNPLIIEGSNYIGGCVSGLRRVDGVKHCPPDNPDGGRTPPGYFWDPTSTEGIALGQTVRPDRTGAYIRIVQTGQHCSGNNMVFTYNNGDSVDQGYNAACAPVVSSSSSSGSTSSGGVGGPGGGSPASGTLTDGSGQPVSGGGGNVSAGDASPSPGGSGDSSSSGGDSGSSSGGD